MAKQYITPGMRVVETTYHIGTVVAVNKEQNPIIMQEGNKFRTVPMYNVDVIPQEVYDEKF